MTPETKPNTGTIIEILHEYRTQQKSVVTVTNAYHIKKNNDIRLMLPSVMMIFSTEPTTFTERN